MLDAKPVVFRGSALDDLRAFPAVARREAGHQIDQVQRGRDLDDWRPMSMVGPGVGGEIRIRVGAGAFQVIYIAKIPDAVYVLHRLQEDAEDQQGGRRLGGEPVPGLGKELGR